ncbi:hypothetical protein ACL1IT_13315 [Corynebacterium striatum]|nr:hypothetical protein [Corynebacterium striatum]HAT1477333.1 hypothetical protein [Corynebacterium striatum]HAT6526623.1 hypothetical protein [Corynebacterium striatum]HAT6564757.1 hypothetical protein [Corynebacterium striatum]HAT6570168.1 hypothetical protein [Corynebacterium striatum]
MNLAGINAFMLGYIEAAIKEQIDPKEVDELFAEAEAVARERLNQPKTQ